MRLGTRVLGNKTHYLLILQNFSFCEQIEELFDLV